MYLLLRAGQNDKAAEVVPPTGAPIFGTLLRAMARKAAGQPYRPLLDSLDNVEGEIDSECSEFLNGMLYRFGDKDAGEFFVHGLTEFRTEGVKSKRVDILLARTYMSLDNDDEARQLLEAALTTYGPDKWLHYYLGTVFESKKQIKEAEKHLKAAVDLDPEDPEILNYLGYLYA